MFSVDDFKKYRENLGFKNKSIFKEFLSAKDITAEIDFIYLEKINLRLLEIFTKLNEIIYYKVDLKNFIENFNYAYKLILENEILIKLTNQGRRCEEVYFSWMRGYLSCEFFKPSLCEIFNTSIDRILSIGDDDLKDISNFKRTPKADLQINNLRIEIQSGFQGINDIKEHKIREAKRIFVDCKMKTLVLHFDLFNGQVAFVDLNNIADDDLNWITRQQMEGQSVLNIDQNYFRWLLLNKPPNITKILEI